MLKAVTDSQEAYYLANGEYSDSIENLDVTYGDISLNPCGALGVGSVYYVICHSENAAPYDKVQHCQA